MCHILPVQFVSCEGISAEKRRSLPPEGASTLDTNSSRGRKDLLAESKIVSILNLEGKDTPPFGIG